MCTTHVSDALVPGVTVGSVQAASAAHGVHVGDVTSEGGGDSVLLIGKEQLKAEVDRLKSPLKLILKDANFIVNYMKML